MFYRFLIEKHGKKSGLFHPKKAWNVPKEGGLYDIVRENFSSLGYSKSFKGKSESWFTEKGVEKYSTQINRLINFYKQFGISVLLEKRPILTDIVDQDEDQVWCAKKK